MWYNLIRLILAGAVACALLPLLRKSKVFNKTTVAIQNGKPVAKRRLPIIVVAIFLGLWQGLTFLPFENLFVEFPTIQAAFQYNRIDRISMIIEGDVLALYSTKQERHSLKQSIPRQLRRAVISLTSTRGIARML